jgi:hypothetical protein
MLLVALIEAERQPPDEYLDALGDAQIGRPKNNGLIEE